MQTSFSKDSFSQIKLFIGAPMYGGVCTSPYLKGLIDLSTASITYNVSLNVYGVTNQSLVQKARNVCATAFLKSDCTHFLFIDADIGFTANDVLSLLYILATDKENKYDVLAGPYPKKTICWETVRVAAKKGFADQNANFLENYTGNYTLLISPNNLFSTKVPVEVPEIDAGFMMIPRRTLEKFVTTHPERIYKIPKGEKEFAFFDCAIDPETNYYIEEDRNFCQHVKKMGGRIWVAPWLKLSHQGAYSFKGSLEHSVATHSE